MIGADNLLGQPVTCVAGYACATNAYNYAGCCLMNNIAGCNIFISCIDYAAYNLAGANPYLYGGNTVIWYIAS
jgi:hypothetical protein